MWNTHIPVGAEPLRPGAVGSPAKHPASTRERRAAIVRGTTASREVKDRRLKPTPSGRAKNPCKPIGSVNQDLLSEFLETTAGTHGPAQGAPQLGGLSAGDLRCATCCIAIDVAVGIIGVPAYGQLFVTCDSADK